MRGFWNDSDGVSVPDVLAIIFTVAYFGVAGYVLYGGLDDMKIDFFSVFTWPILTILGGYFGGHVLGQIGSSLRGGGRRMTQSLPVGQAEQSDYSGAGNKNYGTLEKTQENYEGRI